MSRFRKLQKAIDELSTEIRDLKDLLIMDRENTSRRLERLERILLIDDTV